MVDDRVTALRNEAMRRQRAAGKKLSRLKTVHGVPVAVVDPRVSRDRIAKYNTIQLEAHISRLNRFIDRKTQYVADNMGGVIDRAKYAEYKKVEKQVNAKRRAELAKVADIKLPTGMTIGKRSDLFGVGVARNMATDVATRPVERLPEAFTSQKSVERLTKALIKELNPKTEAKRLKEWRKQAEQMIKNLGDDKLMEKMAKLSGYQFSAMWKFSSFSSMASLVYEQIKAALMGEWNSAELLSQASSESRGLIEWASEL